MNVEPDKSAGSKRRVACTQCRRDTNHLVLKSIDASGSVGGDDSYSWGATYQIIQCQGCETISFRCASTSSDDFIQTASDSWEQVEHETLYPSRTEGRRVVSDSHLLPNTLETMYRETVAALNGSQPVLAGMGIRAVIEAVCKDRQARGKVLFEKINDLRTQGVLTTDGTGILHRLRVLGNDAAHEIKEHSATELNLAADVVEHLLQAVYILPFHAKRTFK